MTETIPSSPDPQPPLGAVRRVPRRVPRRAARRLTFAAAALVAAAGAAVTTTSLPAAPAVGATRPTGAPGPAAIHDPPVIAVVQQQRLELIGAKAGRVRRRLVGAVGWVSLSPNAREIYAERTNGHLDPFPIDRIPANGGPIQRVATGQQPAISPDGTRLAYEAGNGHAVIVETLATGRRRTLDLAPLIGPDATFNNTPNTLLWLSAHQLVAIPPEDGTATSTTTTISTPTTTSTTTTTNPPAGTCSALYAQSRQCAIVIDLNAAHPAHLVTLRLGQHFFLDTAGPGPEAGQLLVGGLSYHAPNIERFAVTDTSARRTGGITIPGDPLVVGFSPTGRHVLYLLGHGPVRLWVGRITSSKVEPTAELIRNALLGTISW